MIFLLMALGAGKLATAAALEAFHTYFKELNDHGN